MKPYAPQQKEFARELRARMTDAEQKLWFYLRRKQIQGLQFYRQKPLGPYIVDFHCPAAKLIVEVDGAQHLEDGHKQRDQARDDALAAQGQRVLRFDDRQVLLETPAVLQVIWQAVQASTSKTQGSLE